MEEKDYSNYILYWYKEDELPIDDFIRLEHAALIENEIMKYKIFIVYRPDFMPPSFISLN